MDVGTLLSVVQTLLASLQCSELKDICSILGYKSELENLKATVETIKAVLRDAESVELSHQQQLWIDELRCAVYDADDLLDEFLTLAQQKKLIKGGRVSKKVRTLFSRFNSLAIAHKFSRGVKEIRKRLDSIVDNHNNFGFKLDCQPTRRRREETCSYVDTKDVIGREKELHMIVSTILYSNVSTDVSCLAIVGIGGLGKTTLAQLIFNHPQIKENFPLKLWTCVSDEDPKNLDLKATLCKILHSVTSGNHENLSTDHLQRKVREVLGEKKYLLVLDDVWNENRLQWHQLAKFLMSGSKGSWIVVTTRSQKTATIVGDEHIYELKGLSEDDSWRLFGMTAFGHRYEQAYPSDLVEIGQEIVKNCANVPLAIRVVGSLLYDQGNEKWQLFQKIGLGRLKQGENGGIEPILKLSYHHLDSPLKICFSYCALFPKDHVIEKEMLINLWISQDYIIPLQEGQSVENASEEYFSILVKRCFFQDITKDVYGNIVSCKIHDLMHDIAQEVAAKEIHATSYLTTILGDKIRHMSYLSSGESTICSFTRNKVRTFINVGLCSEQQLSVGMLLKNCVCLRALDLSRLGIKSLPSALGNLLHLRYLDVSRNYELNVLPNSITKLHNLQTLNVVGCKLKELPGDFTNLVKLRVMDMDSSFSMPRGLGKLSCLQKLPIFVVGDSNSTLKQSVVDQLKDLKALTNLKGSLCIEILENAEYLEENIKEEGYIWNKQHLNCVCILFPYGQKMADCMPAHQAEFLLENLQPHGNLREFELCWYTGVRIPCWETVLPNLVKLKLSNCVRLQHLPSLRKLRYLKWLSVDSMLELKYMDNATSMGNFGDDVRSFESDVFFPSLELLELSNLPKLKGWWRKDGTCSLPSFSCLSKLDISRCPNLTCLPTCPTIEELILKGGNLSKELRIMKTIDAGNSKLRSVITTEARLLKSMLPVKAFRCLYYMCLTSDNEIESLSELEGVFCSCSSSLKELRIQCCRNLKSVCGGLEHLTALQMLVLCKLPRLDLSNARDGEGQEDDGMPWRCLSHNLRSLTLNKLPKMVTLPKGMCYLTALQSLSIKVCKELESLPEYMRDLTSLKTLEIFECSDSLRELYREGDGEGWPDIQHIPYIYIW